MVNWGAFSRDFVAGFRAGGDIVMRADENARRYELAQSAEKRAQGRYDADMADRTAESEYFDSVYGKGATSGVAQKAAAAAAPTTGSGGRSRAMALPSKLGAVTADGTPVPVGPDGSTAAEDEVAETQAARERGFEPASPAPAPRGGLRAKYGDNPTSVRTAESDEAPAYTGRMTRGIAADIERRRQNALDQKNKDRDFGLRREELSMRQRDTDSAISLRTAELDSRSFELTQRKLKMLNDSITGKLQGMDGIDNKMSLVDPSVNPQVKSVVDDLIRFHRATPDGKYVKVNRKDTGYEVIEYDEETSKPISERVVTSVGELRDFGRVAGVLAQSENLGQYTAGVLGDRAVQAISKSKTISEEAKLESQQKVEMFLDRAKLADPKYRKEMQIEAERLAALMGDEAYDKRDVVQSDPDTGRSTKVTVRENRFLKMMELATPATQVDTPDGPITADQFVQRVVEKPQEALKEAGSVENVGPYVSQKMQQRGFPPETAEFYAAQAMQAVMQAQTQAMQKAALPGSTSNAVPQRGGIQAPAPMKRGQPIIDPSTGKPLLNERGYPIIY